MKARRFIWTLIMLAAVIVLMFASRRGGAGLEEIEDHRVLMGTIVTIHVYTDDAALGRQVVDEAFAEMERIEGATSSYLPDSGVTAINSRGPGEEQTHIDLDVSQVLARSLWVSSVSGGAFDVTIAPVTDLWTFEDGASPPDADEISAALDRVGYEAIRLHPTSGNFTMPLESRIDVDGIAKGYAIDKAHRILRTSGVIASGYLDAGGDIRFLGEPLADTWTVGIKHPRRDGLLGTVAVDGGSIATSGDYQHYFISDGERYHHIIDPATGYPAREVLSVTVVTDRCIDADAMATAVFVLGPRRGMRLVESLDGFEALIVTDDGEGGIDEVLISTGLEGRYTAAGEE